MSIDYIFQNIFFIISNLTRLFHFAFETLRQGIQISILGNDKIVRDIDLFGNIVPKYSFTFFMRRISC